MLSDSNRNLTYNRTSYTSKLLFLPLFFILSAIFILSQYPYIRCVIYSLNTFRVNDEKALPSECPAFNRHISSLLVIFRIVKICIDQGLIFVYVFLIFSIFKFPIRNDKFLVKIEIIGTFLVWFITYIVCQSYSLYFNFNILVYLANNVFYTLCTCLIYLYVTVKRNKISPSDFYIMLYNFDVFMKNPICFSYFKEHLKKNLDDDYYYLFFWIDYQCFKHSYFKNDKMKNIEKANYIFLEYFVQNHRGYHSGSTDKGMSTLRLSRVIDFPVEIHEVIEEAANSMFNLDDLILYDLFDEAFAYISNKLFNRYLGMFRHQDELKRIEKLICYIEFDIQY
jgi:hypothetical protein